MQEGRRQETRSVEGGGLAGRAQQQELARLRPYRRRVAALVAACLLCGAAVGAPVRIEVVDARIDDGDVVLVLNRRLSQDWRRTFIEVWGSSVVRERTPDVWRHKREWGYGASGVSVYGSLLRVYDVPADPVALRELMLVVRHAVARTNAAEPSDDPPRADSTLNHLVEDVFPGR